MKKSIFSLIFALVGFGSLTTSCEDMLTPEMDRFAVDFSGKDTVNFYLGIMRNLQGVVEQNVLLGELRGDLVSPTEFVADSVADIMNFSNLEDGENELLNRSAYYKVINQCNFYLAKADSMALKNNNYYMRREIAQVQLVRAWTYMQLVQNYGKVPFLIQPVASSGTGWETTPPDGWVTPDNLLQMLEEKGGLKQAFAYSETLGYPNYGKFNNGLVGFQHRFMTFNAHLIYGDLYLLRGQSIEDYRKAAEHYHTYLEKYLGSFVTDKASVHHVEKGKDEHYFGTAYDWVVGNFANVQYESISQEICTAIPSAANSFFGKILTRIPQIYGFDAKSSNSSSTSIVKDDDNKDKEKTTTTGLISLEANYRNRQLEPSPAYTALNMAQPFVFNEVDRVSKEIVDVKYPALGDLRYNASAPLVTTEKGRLRFIQKFNGAKQLTSSFALSVGDFNFRYAIPLYRVRQIYLRYAEALNRAGFPRHAFAILRDGLHPQNLPSIQPEVVKDTIFTDDTKTDIASVTTTLYSRYDSIANGANTIDFRELVASSDVPWLDFEKFQTKRNVGIRVAGCTGASLGNLGYGDRDSLWTYEKVVSQRMVDEAARQGQTLEMPDLKPYPLTKEHAKYNKVSETEVKTEEGDTYKHITQVAVYEVKPLTHAEVAAVETIIADELALEMAFEGTRYYDLMRIARHRNAAGLDGNEWMAWLLSRRGENLKPYEQPARKGGAIYDRILRGDWYLPAPKNN